VTRAGCLAIAGAIVALAAVSCSPYPPSQGSSSKPALPSPGSIWHPIPRTTWQWQLTTPVDQSVRAEVFDVDLFDNSAEVISQLHAKGAKVVCYIDAGAWEPHRPDADKFPSSVLGKGYGGAFADERWLDVRNPALRPILQAHLDLCRTKGFDGVEFDNDDGYGGDTGFPISGTDQLTFDRWLADQAHQRGLAAGLKNDLGQVGDLVGDFDFQVVEECFEHGECKALATFVKAGKAVFEAEYNLPTAQFCPQARAMGISAMRKKLSLDGSREAC
jgi:hypothetical protein